MDLTCICFLCVLRKSSKTMGLDVDVDDHYSLEI
jgi:hypothetical protein